MPKLAPAKLAQRLAYHERRAITARDGAERKRAREEVDRIAGLLREQKRCRECGRPLRDPKSVAAGIGPDCRANLMANA